MKAKEIEEILASIEKAASYLNSDVSLIRRQIENNDAPRENLVVVKMLKDSLAQARKSITALEKHYGS